MFHKITLKKALYVGILLSIFVAGIVTYVSYSIVKQFTFRRVRSNRWLAKVDRYKQMLREHYKGQPVSFVTQDGVTLAGLLFSRPQAQRALLICHGYSMSKERMHYLVSLFPHDTILLFDSRAHGESQGNFTTIGYYEKNDVKAALQFLKECEETKELPIFGMGFSMGAVSLLCAAAQIDGFKAIIIDSAFKRLDEQISKMFTNSTGLPEKPFMPLCQLIFEYMCNCSMAEVNVASYARQVRVPVLVIHSKHDALADVANAHELYNQLTSSKHLWIVDNARHAVIYKCYPQEYAQKIHEFFESVHKN